MPEHIHAQSVPRGALWGAAFLIVFTIALAAHSRSAQLSARNAPSQPALESAEVRFEDRPDGAIAVLEANTGQEVSVLRPGTNGFIRGVLRGMFRGRKLESLGHDARFTLAREANGRLSIEDPQIGRRVDLDSFGATNSAAFANILTAAVQVR